MYKPDNLPMTFTKNDIEIITREKLYHGSLSLDLYRFHHRLLNGGMSSEATCEIFERGHTAVLLPFGPERDETVLVEQIHIAAFDTSESPWLPEMMAGMTKEGETVEDVACREAMEKARLGVKWTKPVLSYLASPGSTSERPFTLIGEVDATTTSGIHGLTNGNEDTRVHAVSWEQTYQWVEEGEVNNAASVIVLQQLQLHYRKLKTGWKK